MKHLVAIDPQRDFCDKTGSLFVQGAEEDSVRLAKFIDRVPLDDIHVTLDSHHLFDISHPLFWVKSDGTMIDPFTPISLADVEAGTFRPINMGLMGMVKDYLTKLETNGRYAHFIWPNHCLIGSIGASVTDSVYEALCQWEKKNIAFVDYVTKGSNWTTEHFSAVMAQVPDPEDPGTQLNTKFIEPLADPKVTEIYITGQALDYCVANTATDIADNFGDENIKKLILLTDTTSSVNAPGLEHLGPDFIANLSARGMKTALTTDF